jgi:hypothetical protein
VKFNWAVATTSTAVEKKRRDAAEKAKLTGLSEASTDVPHGTGNEVEVSTQSRGEIISASLEFHSRVLPLPLSKGLSTQCPYKLSSSESEGLRSTADLAAELLKSCQQRITHLEREKKTLERKLVGLRFNLDNRIIATKEDEEELASVALAA